MTRAGGDADGHERTERAYDGGAEEFAARTADRTEIEATARRFAELVRPDASGRRLVADLGCGPGHDGPVLRELGLDWIGVERSAGMLRLARGRHPGRYVRGDLRAPPLRGGLDGLWLNASLLHVPREEVPEVLVRLHELLAPGAPLMVSLKAGEGEGVEERPAYDGMSPRWFTYWTAAALDEYLLEAGFEIVHRAERHVRVKHWLVRIALAR